MSPARRSSRSSADDALPLRSLLALAAGAAALPVATPAGAAIIATDLGTQVVGFGSGEASSAGFDLLPGSPKRIVVETFKSPPNDSAKWFDVRARFSSATDPADRIGIQSSARSLQTLPGGSLVAFRTGYGPSWNALPRTNAATLANIVQASKVRTATITSQTHTKTPGGGSATNTHVISYKSAFQGVGPGAFTGQYLLFTFKNSDSGLVNYGWIHVASATRAFAPDGSAITSLSVTFDAWAYQDDGSPIRAGQVAVPEPSTTASLAMGGALVAGAAGLRAWCKKQIGRAHV